MVTTPIKPVSNISLHTVVIRVNYDKNLDEEIEELGVRISPEDRENVFRYFSGDDEEGEGVFTYETQFFVTTGPDYRPIFERIAQANIQKPLAPGHARHLLGYLKYLRDEAESLPQKRSLVTALGSIAACGKDLKGTGRQDMVLVGDISKEGVAELKFESFYRDLLVEHHVMAVRKIQKVRSRPED